MMLFTGSVLYPAFVLKGSSKTGRRQKNYTPVTFCFVLRCDFGGKDNKTKGKRNNMVCKEYL
jgi:hypothetical protein